MISADSNPCLSLALKTERNQCIHKVCRLSEGDCNSVFLHSCHSSQANCNGQDHHDPSATRKSCSKDTWSRWPSDTWAHCPCCCSKNATSDKGSQEGGTGEQQLCHTPCRAHTAAKGTTAEQSQQDVRGDVFGTTTTAASPIHDAAPGGCHRSAFQLQRLEAPLPVAPRLERASCAASRAGGKT